MCSWIRPVFVWSDCPAFRSKPRTASSPAACGAVVSRSCVGWRTGFGRHASAGSPADRSSEPLEADETYVGGKRKNTMPRRPQHLVVDRGPDFGTSSRSRTLKRRVEDVAIRIPASTAIRQDLPAVRRAAGPTGAPRLVATEDTDGTADRFCAAALACAAAETEAAVYALHRIDNHADLRGMPHLGRPGAVRWRGMNRAL